MRMTRIVCFALGVVALTATSARAGYIVNTHAGWNGSEFIERFGSGPAGTIIYNETFGQTFTVTGGNTILDSFSFWLDDTLGTVSFRAYVMAWSDGPPEMATGSILWSSGSPTSTSGNSGFQEFGFTTGGLTLTDNTKYVAFLNASLPDTYVESVSSRMGMSSDDLYLGGEFVRLDNGAAADQATLVSQLTTSTWTVPASNYDAAFVANFSAPETVVPEPGPILAMLSLVSFGAGTVVLRRRRAQKLAA